MQLISKDIIVAELPLFANLLPQERNIIKERSSVIEYKKNELIYEEGSSPSGLYCIILGRVCISAKDEYGNNKILEYLHRGKYFGIISLLTNEAHSVTAQAINDCLVLVIEKKDFDYILNQIPSLAIDLSRTLSRRLKRKDTLKKNIFESTVISLFSSYSQAGKTIYALNLALSLKKETHKSVIILDIAPSDKTHTLPAKLELKEVKAFDTFDDAVFTGNAGRLKDFILNSKFGIDIICFYYNPEDESCIKKIVGILSLLVNDYHYLILDLPVIMDKAVFGILNQSDLIHILTSPKDEDINKTHNLIEMLKQEFNFNEEKIRIVINEYRASKLTHEEQVQILNKAIFATLPRIELGSPDRLILDQPESEYSQAVRRIARQLGDTLVGLVLGVGAAYGFCHIGVLKVIEEEKIPIDVIAGSSIGALIASLWATGKSSSQIMEITGEFKTPQNIWGLIDLTIPRLGFIKGNKLYRFLKRHLNNKTFYDTKIPLKIIASDIKRREPKVFEKGPLVDAIMASCAMPGVFAPFKFREDLLFDGGVINPLPTESLAKIGIKKIIAVNVTPSREDMQRQLELIKKSITGKLPFRTNILDIIFSSIELLQSEVAKKEAQLADVVLHPDTSGLYWLDLHKAPEFAKRGEEEARRNIDKIRQLINE